MQKTANVLIVMSIITLTAGTALGYGGIGDGWKAAYPGACPDLVADVDGCISCHSDYPGGFDLNLYAQHYLSHGENWAAIEDEDSDGDTQNNGDEIAQCTKPWDDASLVAGEVGTWGSIKNLWR